MLIQLCFFCIQSDQEKLILPQTFSCGVTEYFPQEKEKQLKKGFLFWVACQ